MIYSIRNAYYYKGYKWFNGYVTSQADANYLNRVEQEHYYGIITDKRKHAIVCMVIGEVACNS